MLIQQALEHLLIHFVEMTVAHWCSHAFSDSGTSGLYFYEEAGQMREDIAQFGWMEMKIPGEDCQEMENLQRQESIA